MFPGLSWFRSSFTLNYYEKSKTRYIRFKKKSFTLEKNIHLNANIYKHSIHFSIRKAYGGGGEGGSFHDILISIHNGKLRRTSTIQLFCLTEDNSPLNVNISLLFAMFYAAISYDVLFL